MAYYLIDLRRVKRRNPALAIRMATTATTRLLLKAGACSGTLDAPFATRTGEFELGRGAGLAFGAGAPTVYDPTTVLTAGNEFPLVSLRLPAGTVTVHAPEMPLGCV
jgi:hypothetical protein